MGKGRGHGAKRIEHRAERRGQLNSEVGMRNAEKKKLGS
jgi:hypothetical protein